MKYLLENNLLSNKQYGFIKGRTMMLQLLHMMDDWQMVSRGTFFYETRCRSIVKGSEKSNENDTRVEKSTLQRSFEIM